MQKRVWIIDDEQSICWALKRALEQAGYAAVAFSNADDALVELFDSPPIDAILLDMRMPGMDGLTAAEKIKKIRPKVPIIMMTAFGDLSSVMQAMKLDVFEYLTKPFDLADGLKAVAKATAPAVIPSTADDGSDLTLVGSSPAMQKVFKQIALASRSEVSVLIQGPSGIEKESVAAAIHRNSQRHLAPFLAFIPVAISPIALATELLGSIQNNASRSFLRSGAFELASDGTLYIDEVADLTLSLQAQLLRVLEHKKYNRLGDSTSRDCPARIVVSTSRNLRTLVAEGELREDLRQRLGVFTIDLVPLSDRREDIAPLANAILNRQPRDRALSFTAKAMEWLVSRAWPGDIRELRTVIDHAVALTRSISIDAEELSATEENISPRAPKIDEELGAEVRRWTLKHLDRLSETGQRIHGSHSDELFGTMYEDFLSTVEPSMLKAMMDSSNNNRALIAAQLGMHRSTLRQKMRRYGID